MERNSLNNLKDSGRSLRDNFNNNNNNNSNKVNDSCDYNNCCFGGDCLGRFSWPPRSYTCSFCKREFRSAQALGGHMNVHRRDRARLRQSPPWDGQFPEVNPNPNLSSSSSHSSRVPSFTYPFPSLLSPSLTCFSSPTFTSSCVVKTSMGPSQSHEPSSSIGGNMKEMKTMKALFGVGELKGYVQEDECRVLKKAEFDRLNLEMGLCRDSKEDLDLELRLGSS